VPLVAGEASVLGLDPTADARALRGRVGLLGHRNGLYDELTAEENVRFTVRAARMPARGAADALERFGLGGRERSLPAGKLSAGQRRRTALAGIFARRPELWLLDEPHAGLDAEHRRLLGSVLCEVALAGATVVFASHEPQICLDLAHRSVAMSGGSVQGGTLTGAAPPLVGAAGVA
jgi:ABC-type multidrug transport system ATPase subunit